MDLMGLINTFYRFSQCRKSVPPPKVVCQPRCHRGNGVQRSQFAVEMPRRWRYQVQWACKKNRHHGDFIPNYIHDKSRCRLLGFPSVYPGSQKRGVAHALELPAPCSGVAFTCDNGCPFLGDSWEFTCSILTNYDPQAEDGV